ncbi:Cytosine deaminase (C-terminal), authentic frameshift [Latilactobacillus sakei]
MGDGNMLDVLHAGLHATQMMGYTEIMNAYRFITHNGARAMHVTDQYGLEVGKPAHLILMASDNFYNAINQRAAVTLSIHAGRIISETQPATTQLFI